MLQIGIHASLYNVMLEFKILLNQDIEETILVVSNYDIVLEPFYQTLMLSRD